MWISNKFDDWIDCLVLVFDLVMVVGRIKEFVYVFVKDKYDCFVFFIYVLVDFVIGWLNLDLNFGEYFCMFEVVVVVVLFFSYMDGEIEYVVCVFGMFNLEVCVSVVLFVYGFIKCVVVYVCVIYYIVCKVFLGVMKVLGVLC